MTGPDIQPGPRAVVAGHGTFAVGLVSAVEQISGRGEVFASVSNTGLGPADIETALVQALDATGAQVMFTDLAAGSCTMAARRLLRARPGLVLVTGVNLATLLEFVFHSNNNPKGQSNEQLDINSGVRSVNGAKEHEWLGAARSAAEKGRAALVVHGG